MKKTLPGKKIFIIVSFCCTAFTVKAQEAKSEINRIETPSVALAPLRFLASDELKGRATARPEIQIAARYISTEFRSLQLKQFSNAPDYFQTFDIKMITPATSGRLNINGKTYQLGEDMVQLNGADVNLEAPVIFANYGSEEDFKKMNVKGKIVITGFGTNDTSHFREAFQMIKNKRKLAEDNGAAALIELSAGTDVPWKALQNFTSQEHVGRQDEADTLPVFLLKDTGHDLQQFLKSNNVSANITVTGTLNKIIPAKNVLAYVEGTGSELKNQYILLSAHYDHLGVAKKPVMEDGKMDSIYNGARDNAVGVTAVMDAARYFVQHPPKRSVMFIAYTGEEIGEIGSKYFAAHPVIPLKQIVYNMNIDNGDYNDTTIITVVGLGRTSADEDIQKGCNAFGLKSIADPAPEQDLFDRSDNVNLAEKGIPSPTFSLGFTKFDAETMKHYHHVSDEVGNMNLSYVMKYIKSYILAAKNIADDPAQPTWTKSDKYEKAGQELYHSITGKVQVKPVLKLQHKTTAGQ
jgi:Zn-dependent M28 family amino/carboxypeptidase